MSKPPFHKRPYPEVLAALLSWGEACRLRTSRSEKGRSPIVPATCSLGNSVCDTGSGGTMPVRLNITVDRQVYVRLKKALPPKRISAFINDAVRARLFPDRRSLDEAYKAAARCIRVRHASTWQASPRGCLATRSVPWTRAQLPDRPPPPRVGQAARVVHCGSASHAGLLGARSRSRSCRMLAPGTRTECHSGEVTFLALVSRGSARATSSARCPGPATESTMY